jgi:hypothetical protein
MQSIHPKIGYEYHLLMFLNYQFYSKIGSNRRLYQVDCPLKDQKAHHLLDILRFRFLLEVFLCPNPSQISEYKIKLTNNDKIKRTEITTYIIGVIK